MAKLLRPYIPYDIRLRVILRQLGEVDPDGVVESADRQGKLILTSDSLMCLLADKLGSTLEDLQLDHDPALENREKVFRRGVHVGYRPDANDPNHLIYRTKHDHHIKTNVRGDGAQYSDRALAKRERKRQKGKKQSRPLKSASRWPPRGSRKIPSRATGRGGTPVGRAPRASDPTR